MDKPETGAPLIPVTPHDDDSELRRIGVGLRALFADTLSESLPGDMLVLLLQLDRPSRP
jgi:hypothetical protein